MDESLAQYAFALAMDEDNLLSLLVLVFIHRLLEYIHLIMKDISRIHTGSCLQHLVSMKVYNEHTIILLALLLAGVGNHLLVLIHLLLQSFGIDNQRTSHLIVLYDGEEIGWSLKEIVLLEEMKLVEFHWVQTELHVSSRLQEERFLLLVGNHLDGDVLHFVQSLATEFLNEEFGIRFDFTFCLQGPGIALCHEISIMQIIVAVVHHIGLETGIGHVLDVDRHEGEISTELVAARTLLNVLDESDFPVSRIIIFLLDVSIMLIENRLDASAVLMQFGVGMFFRLLLGIHLCRNHLTHGVVVLLYHHHLVDRHRDFKSILILYQHNIFSLEAGNLTAAHFTEESYFISFFHIFYFLYSYLLLRYTVR